MPTIAGGCGGERGSILHQRGRPPHKSKLHHMGRFETIVSSSYTWILEYSSSIANSKKEFMEHIGFGIWLIREHFLIDFFLLVFVVYAFILWRKRLSRLVSQDHGCHFKWHLRPANTDWSWSCFQQGKARWNQMYIEQLKMSNVMKNTNHESCVSSSPKLQMKIGKFLWVLQQIFDMLSNLLRSFVLLGSSLFMI